MTLSLFASGVLRPKPHNLKGVLGAWHVYAVSDDGAAPAPLTPAADHMSAAVRMAPPSAGRRALCEPGTTHTTIAICATPHGRRKRQPLHGGTRARCTREPRFPSCT